MSPFIEYKKLSGIVEEIKAKAELSMDVFLRPLDHWESRFQYPLTFFGGRHPAGYGEIMYVPGIMSRMPEEEIKGVIAHELSHIVHDDRPDRPPEIQRAQEYNADLFAVKLGYGSGLLKAFRDYYAPSLGLRQMEDSDSHPAMSKRIEILQEAVKSATA